MRDKKPSVPVIGVKDIDGILPDLIRIAKNEHLTLSQVVRRALRREVSESGK